GVESGAEMESIFRSWNEGELQSFLIEITADIVNHRDSVTGTLLLDQIVDSAGQKGTGKWTTVAAMKLGVPIPTITAAVDARLLSSLRAERHEASKAVPGIKPHRYDATRVQLVDDV